MMKKTNKTNNRREKLKERKRNAEANRLILSEKLSSALVALCAPDLPEYTDDRKGIDIVGRKIISVWTDRLERCFDRCTTR